MGLLIFGHQILIADLADEVILGADIMVAYGFGIDLSENVLMVAQEKKNFCSAQMGGTGSHMIKQATDCLLYTSL